jgi:hypothetical protein
MRNLSRRLLFPRGKANMRNNNVSPTNIQADTPLRLKDAVTIAFPAGGMTLSGLRREIARGRLEAELIAGKYFTTLADIARMRELCRVAVEPSVSKNQQRASDPRREPQSFTTDTATTPKERLLRKLELLRQKPTRKS